MSNLPKLLRFEYDRKTKRYRNLNTGRYISEKEILDKIEERIDRSRQNLEAFGKAHLSGKLSLMEFRTLVAVELKEAHVQMAVMGAGGFRVLQDDSAYANRVYGQVGSLLKKQYNFLNNFISDLQTKNVSEAQFYTRLKMYADSIWTTYHTSQKLAAIKAGFTEMKRTAIDDEVTCGPCHRYAARGWVRINDPDPLPMPGEKSPCMGRCRCDVEYR